MTEQKPLFGDLDLVINTLETEASEITKRIEKAQESIDRKEAEITGLEERLANIRTSLAEIRKRVEAKEEKADAPF
jgi:predicted  nucleic acid-binding Zn-ribbon protein